MQWLSHSLDCDYDIVLILTFLWIKTNVAYIRLEVIARTKLCAATYGWEPCQTDK